MISKEENRVLLSIATEAESRWPEYAAYCRSREAGLRNKAFQHLYLFVSLIGGAPIADRREFVDWVCERFWRNEPSSASLIPVPLLSHVLRPTLENWMGDRPHESVPFRWAGVLASAAGYLAMRTGFHVATSDAESLLTKAVEIDPGDQVALVRLIECRIGILDFSAHHLPHAYLGDPQADLKSTDEIERLCQGVRQKPDRERLVEEVRTARQIILDWTESQRADTDFITWCREHNRNYHWAVTRVYVRPEERKTSPNVHIPGVIKTLTQQEIQYRIIAAQSPEDKGLNEWTERAFPFVGSQIDWKRVSPHRCVEWGSLEDLVPAFQEMAGTLNLSSPVVVMWGNALCPPLEMKLEDVMEIARAIFEEHETSTDVFVFSQREGWLIEMHHEGTLCLGRTVGPPAVRP